MWEYIKATCSVTASPSMLKPPAISRLPKTPGVTSCHRNSTVTRTLSSQALPGDPHTHPRNLQAAEKPWCHRHSLTLIAAHPWALQVAKDMGWHRHLNITLGIMAKLSAKKDFIAKTQQEKVPCQDSLYYLHNA